MHEISQKLFANSKVFLATLQPPGIAFSHIWGEEDGEKHKGKRNIQIKSAMSEMDKCTKRRME